MQDRYAGDVGDFGKFGMLRCMEKAGIRVGINWYLVDDESHNNDGKHTGYLSDRKFHGCDLVFLNPDNGMLPKSVSRGSDKSIKYVLPEEIMESKWRQHFEIIQI